MVNFWSILSLVIIIGAIAWGVFYLRYLWPPLLVGFIGLAAVAVSFGWLGWLGFSVIALGLMLGALSFFNGRSGLMKTGAVTVLVGMGGSIAFAVVPTANADETPEQAASLIAKAPEVDCVALAKKYNLTTVTTDGTVKIVFTYITNEVGVGSALRLFGDSVNIPLDPTERDRVLLNICTQPEMAGMVGHAFANKVMLDGKVLSEINPTLLSELVKLTPKEWADKVLSGAITYDVALKVARQLAGIFTVYNTDNKVHDGLQTSWNYHSQEGFLSTAGNVRPITLNDREYEGKFLVFEITEKGAEGCWSRFGINVEDQRIVGLPCEKPKPKPTPTPTNPTTAPPTTAPPTTAPPTTAPPTTAPPTTAPPTTAPPTTAPPTTTTPSPSKNPSSHPANNDNATPPATPAPTVTESTSRPSTTPSATYTPAPRPEPSKTRTVEPTQAPPPEATATKSIDPCKEPGAENNPAC